MNILIVDDEPLIHASIEYELRMLNMGPVEIFHASSGEEMLTRMGEREMDLALVDVQLKGITGLEAIQQAKERWPDTTYYIMSGFSEFSYAQDAVRLRVTEYLLKPLEPEVLKKILVINQQKKELQRNQMASLLRGWLEGALHRHDVSNIFPAGYYGMILLQTWDLKGGAPCLPAQTSLEGARIPCDEGALTLLISRDREKLNTHRRELLGYSCVPGETLFLSRVERSAQALYEQLHGCLGQASVRVYNGLQRVYEYGRLPNLPDREKRNCDTWIGLAEAYRNGVFSDYSGRIPKAMAAFRGAKCSRMDSDHLREFLHTAMGIIPEDTMDSESLQKSLTTMGNHILQNKSVDKVELVLHYVGLHYCEELSLAELAQRFDLTPNYLGTLLKNRAGMKFTDYLAYLRLSRAKELLSTTRRSVREIAEEVGYYSLSYFSKLFQEKEGCTPAEFRNKRAGNSGEK